VNEVKAYGGATVSWIAPTTNDDSPTFSALTDLAGYRVYYKNTGIDCTNWEAAPQTGANSRQADGNPGTLLPAPYRNVANPSALSFTFNNTTYLTPGSSYNFVVVAYDSSGNLSNCAMTSGSAKFINKPTVSYSADIDTSGPSLHKVNLMDYNLLFANFGNTTPGNIADLDKNNIVNLFDYNILFGDFGASF
jgi:hypothetical protein